MTKIWRERDFKDGVRKKSVQFLYSFNSLWKLTNALSIGCEAELFFGTEAAQGLYLFDFGSGNLYRLSLFTEGGSNRSEGRKEAFSAVCSSTDNFELLFSIKNC